jgi:hypothetical protein
METQGSQFSLNSNSDIGNQTPKGIGGRARADYKLGSVTLEQPDKISLLGSTDGNVKFQSI